MSEHTDITQRADDHVFVLFKEKLPEDRVYHNYAHSRSVAKAARTIAAVTKLSEEGIEIAVLAAWFQDTGYIEEYAAHLDVSKRIAESFLRDNSYPPEKIELVLGCIEATRMPQRPQNLLEEIVCDAAASLGGKRSFFESSTLLRIERERVLGERYTDDEWNKHNLDFLTEQKFFTKYAQLEYGDQLSENIRSVDKQIRKEQAKLSSKVDASLAAVTMQTIIDPEAQNKTHLEQGIETIIKTLNTNVMSLLGQAERHAQMLLLTTSLLTIILIGCGIPLMGAKSGLIIPMFVLISVPFLAMVFAALAARPKINRGSVSRESIIHRKANLMYFGNFYKMRYEDFSESISETMTDQGAIQSSLMKESFFIGKIVGKKHKYLRWSYDVFLYGLVFSLFLFLMAFLFPEVFRDAANALVTF